MLILFSISTTGCAGQMASTRVQFPVLQCGQDVRSVEFTVQLEHQTGKLFTLETSKLEAGVL